MVVENLGGILWKFVTIKYSGLKELTEDLDMIKEATFTSVWDGGYEVTTNCKINMETKEVFDIETVDVDVNILEYEYVTIDGKEYPVSNDEATEYWYD